MTDSLVYNLELKIDDANRKLDRFLSGTNSAAKKEGKKAGKSFGDSFKSAFQGVIATIGFGQLTSFIKSAGQAAVTQEQALKSLAFVAPRFNQDAEQARQAAEALAEELKIGVGPAAASLQNLFKAGLDIDQSTDLLRRFTNEAVNGKSANIDLATAVENLSFAYATNNSQLGNLSGIQENFSDLVSQGQGIIDDYAQGTLDLGENTEQVTSQIEKYERELRSQGKALDSADKEQAKYIGTLALTNLTLGATEDAFDGVVGAQADYDLALKRVRVAIGEALLPALTKLIEALTPILENITEFVKANPEVASTFLFVATAVAGLSSALFILSPIMGLVVKTFSFAIPIIKGLMVALTVLVNPITILGIAVAGLAAIFILNWDKIKAIVGGAIDRIQTDFQNFTQTADRTFREFFNSVTGFFGDTWDEARRLFDEFVNFFQNTASELGRIFKQAFDGVAGGAANIFKSAFNGIISIINDALGVLNSFINDIKNTVNQIPGVSIDIPRVPKIPRLASGGFIDKPTLAVVGEAGSEAVLNNDAVNRLGLTKSAVDSINSGGTVNNNQNMSRNLTVNNFGGAGQREFDNLSLVF